MGGFLFTVAIGILLIIIGICNMNGHITTLHKYHRYRVSEEDIKPFGKAVGLGTIICGASCALYGITFLIYELTSQEWVMLIGTVGLAISLFIGIFIALRAIFKYNNGLF